MNRMFFLAILAWCASICKKRINYTEVNNILSVFNLGRKSNRAIAKDISCAYKKYEVTNLKLANKIALTFTDRNGNYPWDK